MRLGKSTLADLRPERWCRPPLTEPKRLVVIARRYAEAKDFLKSRGIWINNAVVITGEYDLYHLRAMQTDTHDVVMIGYWEDGFERPGDILFALGVRGIVPERLGDWR